MVDQHRESEEWHDRRQQQREQMRALIDDVLNERVGLRSLTKNGHSVSEWLSKALTPERLFLLVIMIVQFAYVFGGRVQRYDQTTGLVEEQQRRTTVMQEQHERINQQIRDIVALQKMQMDQLSLHTDALTAARELAERAVRQNADLQANINARPTRRDLNAITNQQLLPRLDRIEQKVDGK